MGTTTTTGRWKVTLIAVALIAMVGLLVAAAAKGEERADRLDRKIRVMEKVLDEVLTQSKHVRVGMSGETTGLVVEDYGAIFIFRGELGGDIDKMPDLANLFRTLDEAATWHDEEALSQGEKEKYSAKSLDQVKKEIDAKHRAELASLRDEVIDTILDYGPTLAELGEDRWVMLVGVLDGGIFAEHEAGGSRSTLTVKMKISDLRQLAGGALTRQAALSKVVVTMK